MKYDHLIGSTFNKWTDGKYTPSQLEAFKDYDSSVILNVGSFRSGKTEFLVRNAIKHVYYFPNSKSAIFRQHRVTLARTTMSQTLGLIHPSWVVDWSNTALELRLKNNSVIYFIGADSPDKLGSLELTQANIDETSEVDQESFNMIQGRLSGKLQIPSNFDKLAKNIQEYILGTYNKTQMVCATNPKSKGHYLYKEFIQSPKRGYRVYTSNSVANPNIPENFIINNLAAYLKPGIDHDFVLEAIRLIRNDPTKADGLFLEPYLTAFGQRNLLGLWVALEGAIYYLDESLHTVIPSEWVPTGEFIAGVDYGFHNPRVVVIELFTDPVSDKVCFATRDYWHAKNSGDDLLNAIETLDSKYDLMRVYFPHDQPGILRKARHLIGSEKCRKAKTAVIFGIDTVSSLLGKRLRFDKNKPNYDVFFNEMSGYAWDTVNGIPIDKPIKVNDHYPDAVRYAIYSYMLSNLNDEDD